MSVGTKQDNFRWNILWHVMPAVAFFIWGTLCVTDQLWYDEAFSAGQVMKSWMEMVYITAVDAHSPFYYACLKLFYHLCGGGTHFWKLKLFSLLFMLGYMLLGKYYVAKLFGKKISVWLMVFSLLAPIMTVQAGNVRMYAMALFFMTLTGLLAYDIYREESRGKWLLFVFSSICIVYCHTFAMIQTVWLYLIFLAALLRSRQFQKLKKCFLSGIAVSVVFSPWLYVTFRQMQFRMNYVPGATPDYAGTKELMDYCREWFSAVETPIEFVVYLGMALFVVMFALAVLSVRRENNAAPLLGAAAFGLTALTGFLVSAFVNNCFLGRYAFPGFGFIMLLYAVGMVQVRPMWARICILVTACVCFVLQYRSEFALEYDGGLRAYESFWEEHVGERDAVLAPQGHTVFLSVYHPETEYYLAGYVPANLPFPNLAECYDVGQLARQIAGDQGTLWYIAFAGGNPADVGEDLVYEEAASFHYMYYDFVIYQIK